MTAACWAWNVRRRGNCQCRLGRRADATFDAKPRGFTHKPSRIWCCVAGSTCVCRWLLCGGRQKDDQGRLRHQLERQGSPHQVLRALGASRPPATEVVRDGARARRGRDAASPLPPCLQNEDQQQQIVREIFSLLSKRSDAVCNFLEGGRCAAVWRRRGILIWAPLARWLPVGRPFAAHLRTRLRAAPLRTRHRPAAA